MKAYWNNQLIADSNQTIVVEGNHYFPPGDIKKEFFKENSHTTVCPWKGKASYYDIVVDEKENSAAAWYYPEPKDAAAHIKNYIAFWKGVEVKE
jgi:uncharacterized protein (DUF427 family)